MEPPEHRVLKRQAGGHLLFWDEAEQVAESRVTDRLTVLRNGVRIEQPTRGEWYVEVSRGAIHLGEKWLEQVRVTVPDSRTIRLTSAEASSEGDVDLAVGPATVTIATRNLDAEDLVQGRPVSARGGPSQHDIRIHIQVSRHRTAAPSSTPTSPLSQGNTSQPMGRDPHTGPVVDLYDDDLDVHYGFFDLTGTDEIPKGELGEARAGQANGLCGTKLPGQVSCVTGLHTGQVHLRIEWLASAPQVDQQWEDVVEASVNFTDRDISLASFEDGAHLELPETGWHRVRYCVVGMDAGREMDTPDEGESAPDRYLVQLWPAPPAPDEVVALGSETAAYWHRTARGEET